MCRDALTVHCTTKNHVALWKASGCERKDGRNGKKGKEKEIVYRPQKQKKGITNNRISAMSRLNRKCMVPLFIAWTASLTSDLAAQAKEVGTSTERKEMGECYSWVIVRVCVWVCYSVCVGCSVLERGSSAFVRAGAGGAHRRTLHAEAQHTHTDILLVRNITTVAWYQSSPFIPLLYWFFVFSFSLSFPPSLLSRSPTAIYTLFVLALCLPTITE